MDWLPRPKPPLWAIEAGLPEPRDDEGFCSYAERLGYDPVELTRGLTPQTAPNALVRLNSRIICDMRDVFRAHVRSKALAWSTERRVKTLEVWAADRL